MKKLAALFPMAWSVFFGLELLRAIRFCSPPEYHVAIEKSRKITLPDYPPIRVYFWSEKYWSIGITETTIGDTTVKIYEREKSVCDAIKFRNKIGKDVEREVLTNYLKAKNRNIDKLLRYARLLRVEAQMKTYLSILL